ncbi:Scr1 family TA system antitoxin-like transcriptional regulator [Streptantibioticus parmotrematis]|uniref:Scr1 family TA system antitoxin-like transcriptional regulator n=1 Tax=Streptantibioticus parmotrematis TaxID=2873249 RepID=UPI003F4D44AB
MSERTAAAAVAYGADSEPEPAVAPAGPVHTRETASDGYRRALAAHQEVAPPRRVDPAIADAVERRTAAVRALSARAFSESEVPDEQPAPIEAARAQRRHQAAATEAAALRYRIGGAAVLTGQLGYLLSVMALPSVSIGIIPMDVDRSLWPVEGFFLYDDKTVNVELVSAHLTVVQDHELAMYAQTFAELAELAVYGHAAKQIITAAIESIG